MANPVKIEAIVKEVNDHGDGVFAVSFEVPKWATRFKAGQFLHLTLEEFDPVEGFWPESRVFSIASQPRNDYVEILFSVKNKYTERMSREIKPGQNIWLKLPYGDFIIKNHVQDKSEIVLIAGGTGIAPFIPYLLEWEQSDKTLPLTLYYGIRNNDHYYYKELINRLSNIADINVANGSFDINGISDELSKKENIACFISGPPDMIQMFKNALISKGVGKNDIIIDAWE